MNENDFLKNFKEQFIDEAELSISFDTKFRDIGSWDSLTGMAIIVMVEDQYKVSIPVAEFKELQTIKDVLNYVKEKTN